jgi:hypothetical protein
MKLFKTMIFLPQVFKCIDSREKYNQFIMSCVDYSRIVNQNIDTKGSACYFQSGIRNNQNLLK